jgi:hypothetical protein
MIAVVAFAGATVGCTAGSVTSVTGTPGQRSCGETPRTSPLAHHKTRDTDRASTASSGATTSRLAQATI